MTALVTEPPATSARTIAAPVIAARGLSKRYSTEDGCSITALQNVSFDIAPGEFISIVGPSGCGKSTLLKIVAGLLPYSGGSIDRAGQKISAPGPDVSIVFQTPVLLPWRTIIQNVLLPIEFRHGSPARYRGRALSLLAMVGLKEFADRYPPELSGGMQQRAAIVRALVQDPQILLMDEPFGALDAMTREQLNLDVLRIWDESRKTVLFVTHSIAESVFLSDRVFVMTPRPGRLSAIIEINLPRPRALAMINTERAGSYIGRVRELLQAQGSLSG